MTTEEARVIARLAKENVQLKERMKVVETQINRRILDWRGTTRYCDSPLIH